MTDFIKERLEEAKARHRRGRTFLAGLAVLSVFAAGAVFWQLRQTGISATSDVVCGLAEHVHTEDCYETHFICGLEEGQEEVPGHTHGPECYEETRVLRCEKEPHTHGDDCYTEKQVLTCALPEHTHGKDCYDSDGTLVCTQEEHSHGEDCYTVEQVLTCTLEPHEHDESCYEETEVLTCTQEERAPVAHVHTDACRETTLTCTVPEHTHDETCLPDLTADVEDTETLRTNAANPGTGIWNTDLLAVAKAQLGYRESTRNFILDDDGTRHGYTRYGESYGDPYGPWDGMFLAYCLRYSGVPEYVAPQRAGVSTMLSESAGSLWLRQGSAEMAQPGDIVFFHGTAGVVSLGGEALTVICGDVSNAVHEQSVSALSVTRWISIGEAYAANSLPILSPVEDDFTLPVEEKKEDVEKEAEKENEEGKETDVESPALENASQSAESTNENEQSQETQTGTAEIIAQSVDLTQGCKLKYTLQKWNGETWTDNFNRTDMVDGDKIKFSFTYEIPHGRGSSPTAYYKLPAGILPSKSSGVIYNPSDNTQIGSYEIKDGVVLFTYDADFWNTASAIGGNFEMEGELDRSQLGTDAKISFPGTGEVLDVRGYIYTDKTASKRYDGDDLVFRYTIPVSTKNSTGPGTITISDSLNANAKSIRGYYITDSIKCYGPNGTEIPLAVGENLTWTGLDTDKPSFKITGLTALSKGQTYSVIYDVRIPKESFDDPNSNGGAYDRIYNSAKAECQENSWTDNDRCSFPQRIQKDGAYERRTGRIKWTVTVNNPGDERQYLTGYRLWDVLPQGLRLVSDVSLYANDTKGVPFQTISARDFMENGFLFEDTTQLCKNYIFEFYTDVPASETGLRLINTANLQKGDTTYSASKPLDILAGDWEAAKSFLRTDGDIAYWSFYAVNSTGSKNFMVTDTVDSREGTAQYPLDHYGLVAELQSAIEKGLRIEMEDGSVLSYSDAADSLDVVYLDSDGNTLTVGDVGHVARFTITFRGEFVKSIALTDYPTHMVQASVLLGHTRSFYNTLQVGNSTSSAQTEYTNEKAFEKLVSSDGGKSFSWGGTAEYKEGMTLLYRLELQVAAGMVEPVYDTLPEGCTLEGTPTVTIDGGTARNIVPTVDGRRLTFAIVDCLPDASAHRLVIQYCVKLNGAEWADKMKAEGKYTNTAQWGQEMESITTTVQRQIPPLEKTATVEEGQTGLIRRVKYTVFVNLGKKDFQKDYLNLKDTISLDSSKAKVELDLSSVQLCYYDYATQSKTPLPEGTYQILESNGECLLKLSVPNRTAMVLTYECTFTLLSTGDHNIQNVISLEDYEGYNSSFPIKLSTDAASAYAGQLKISKVDPLGKPLSGAVFQAEPYEQDDQENWAPGTPIALHEATKGYFSVGVSTDGANGTLKINTLYRIWESEAPAGYIKDGSSRYVMFYNTSLQEAQALAASIPDMDGKTILYSAHTATLSVKMENAPDKLTIQKQWTDPDNKPLDDPGVTQIQVRLRRKTDTGKDEAFSKVLTLTKDNAWKLTLEFGQDGIDAMDGNGNPYYYYIEKEIDPPDNWHVSFLNNDGVRTGTIYVQNRVYSYKLPETGGIGINRFLYIGGALMLGSGILLRKKGKRK